jgi:predicted helicase
MLAYGLFLAKLNAGDDDVIRLDNVRQFIPGSFRLIRELVRFLEDLKDAEYDEAKWVIDEILSIVNGLAIDDIRDDLSFRQRRAVSRKVRAGDEEEHRLFERDPFIYFYEDFLKAYDKETRKARGVYYTPPPVVNFIVRAVDDILKDTFKIGDGLADHKKVTVLDFAAGTGTFLLEVMQRIFDNIGGPEKGKAASVVREHMLKNLYGFEYLIAPYTIAHLKLSQYLKDKGHPLENDERLQVYLTNTLEPVAPQKSAFLPELSKEIEEAQKVKDKPVLVILGNPPYSGQSKNRGAWITRAIDGYKYTTERVQTEIDADGNAIYSDVEKPLGEKNSKWLNDDYVKFIRFAQLKMDSVEEGIVGIITNHSWLENPTFRGMRQSLIRSFDQIYVLDLHGNVKKRERTPNDEKDENVFDIEQGVAISLFVKKKNAERGVWRGDVWGKRLTKYQNLADGLLTNLAPAIVRPTTPYYRYETEDEAARIKYNIGFPVPAIFEEGGTGIITKRDALAIQFSESAAWDVVQRLVALEPEQARQEFRLPPDVRDWKVADAQADIRRDGPTENKIRRIRYRPFDDRFTYYTGRARGFLGWPVERIARHFEKPNIGLITSRLTKGEDFRHVQVTDLMNEVIVMSSITSNNGFTYPLWLHGDVGTQENLSPDFRAFLDTRYDHHYSPEEILGCIYAILNSSTYRQRYAAFLRIDFPRIPFPEQAEDFERLSKLGWALVQAHLLRELPRSKLADYHGRGDNVVEQISWSAEDSRISINAKQSFAPVPEAVWNFHIGGYQVLDKYLKSRKGRTLSLDEINHVARIADALAFTIDQMEKIDAAYVESFPQ